MPSIFYVDTKTRVTMLKSKKETFELSEDSNEIFKSGMMRPKQNDVKNICFAVFASCYFKPTKVENDYQPDYLSSDITIIDYLGLALTKKHRYSS